MIHLQQSLRTINQCLSNRHRTPPEFTASRVVTRKVTPNPLSGAPTVRGRRGA
jgi:hypothetical protein